MLAAEEVGGKTDVNFGSLRGIGRNNSPNFGILLLKFMFSLVYQ
jgi:hypothetical protein